MVYIFRSPQQQTEWIQLDKGVTPKAAQLQIANSHSSEASGKEITNRVCKTKLSSSARLLTNEYNHSRDQNKSVTIGERKSTSSTKNQLKEENKFYETSQTCHTEEEIPEKSALDLTYITQIGDPLKYNSNRLTSSSSDGIPLHSNGRRSPHSARSEPSVTRSYDSKPGRPRDPI